MQIRCLIPVDLPVNQLQSFVVIIVVLLICNTLTSIYILKIIYMPIQNTRSNNQICIMTVPANIMSCGEPECLFH